MSPFNRKKEREINMKNNLCIYIKQNGNKPEEK